MRRRSWRRWLLPAVLLFGGAAGPLRLHDPNVLWKIVHDRCVPEMASTGSPSPCISVTLDGGAAHGFAVLKDIRGQTQYLLIPTARITGIESPALLRPGATNYFARAWDIRDLTEKRAGHELPDADILLAINSRRGRTQDQLHIHVDCIRPDVLAALRRMAPGVGDGWRELPEPLVGHRYRAMWIAPDALDSQDPFRLLAASLGGDPATLSRRMARHTLALTGSPVPGRPGFLLLDSTAGMGSFRLTPAIDFGPGSAEELEDHSCRIASGGT
ncbi:CDP-diacylglycerol diphosphatase [Rhizosaccharibacter radicis]|uniref:CDP-diacylglycerol pyrophosphatase n=1 Tax=Rhizosaccharibacter radicis TaxID=2782605 RepID=A0ABT1VZS6_9PROT|nr:CDP-diacylglycerol diphosphatase [Acetobacteraceae bacterium KSS12]